MHSKLQVPSKFRSFPYSSASQFQSSGPVSRSCFPSSCIFAFNQGQWLGIHNCYLPEKKFPKHDLIASPEEWCGEALPYSDEICNLSPLLNMWYMNINGRCTFKECKRHCWHAEELCLLQRTFQVHDIASELVPPLSTLFIELHCELPAFNHFQLNQ